MPSAFAVITAAALVLLAAVAVLSALLRRKAQQITLAEERFRAADAEHRSTLARLESELSARVTDLARVDAEAAANAISIRQAEDRLRAGQRLEAMGQLAGGVAHDFSNMMTVVTGYSDVLLAEVEGNPDAHNAVLEIRKAGERCASLTNHLLAFSRRQILSPTVLDLNEIVDDLCQMLPMLIGEEIQVVTVPGEALGRIQADAAQIEQVIVNLVVNARDAMPDGGTLTIQTANVRCAAGGMFDHHDFLAGDYVVLTIADTGRGMDDETRALMFDPFFTTKPPGQGTGLGLSTVYGVIKQSAGHILVDSEPGRGTTFRIYLPRVPDPEPAPVLPASPGDADGGAGSARRTILLVEDEGALRRMLHSVLQRSGYDVRSAASAEEALVMMGAHAGALDILVTDVILPDINGVVLAQKIREQRPDVRVLFMSGYTHEVVEQALMSPDRAFIQKPFTPPRFLAKIREVLDAAR